MPKFLMAVLLAVSVLIQPALAGSNIQNGVQKLPIVCYDDSLTDQLKKIGYTLISMAIERNSTEKMPVFLLSFFRPQAKQLLIVLAFPTEGQLCVLSEGANLTFPNSKDS